MEPISWLVNPPLLAKGDTRWTVLDSDAIEYTSTSGCSLAGPGFGVCERTFDGSIRPKILGIVSETLAVQRYSVTKATLASKTKDNYTRFKWHGESTR
jgi:hypothetical protein